MLRLGVAWRRNPLVLGLFLGAEPQGVDLDGSVAGPFHGVGVLLGLPGFAGRVGRPYPERPSHGLVGRRYVATGGAGAGRIDGEWVELPAGLALRRQHW